MATFPQERTTNLATFQVNEFKLKFIEKKITKKINRGWAAAASEAHPTGPAAEAAKQVAARFAE